MSAQALTSRYESRRSTSTPASTRSNAPACCSTARIASICAVLLRARRRQVLLDRGGVFDLLAKNIGLDVLDVRETFDELVNGTDDCVLGLIEQLRKVGTIDGGGGRPAVGA